MLPDREAPRNRVPAQRARSSTMVHTTRIDTSGDAATGTRPAHPNAHLQHSEGRRRGGTGSKTPVPHGNWNGHGHGHAQNQNRTTSGTGTGGVYPHSRGMGLGHYGTMPSPTHATHGRSFTSQHNVQMSSAPTSPPPGMSSSLASPSGVMSDSDVPSGLFSTKTDRTVLSLYTYTPNASASSTSASSTSLLPAPAPNLASSRVQFSYASLPWPVKVGDYLEIRRISPAQRTGTPGPTPVKNERSGDGDAVEGVKPDKGRDGYVFQVREDMPNVPLNQIQVPNSVANAYRLQHRQDVEVIKISDPQTAYVDFIELHFSQYVGRADMWRLGMSLENTTVHVGEKVTLAGGAVRADIQGIWRGRHRYSSGIVTSKTKTIYRSKSAQTYIFISICQETYEFDEDGEQYYEKILHGA